MAPDAPMDAEQMLNVLDQIVSDAEEQFPDDGSGNVQRLAPHVATVKMVIGELQAAADRAADDAKAV